MGPFKQVDAAEHGHAAGKRYVAPLKPVSSGIITIPASASDTRRAYHYV